MNHDFQIRRATRDPETGEFRDPVLLRHHTFVAAATGTAGAALLGTGISLYGANKQNKANAAAQAENARLQEEQNRSAWGAYLLARGVNPQGAATGQIPTNPQAINAKLPLWANVRRTAGGSYQMARPMGANPPASSLGSRTWEGLGIKV